MYDLGCCKSFIETVVVLHRLTGLYGLKYDSATACGPPLYLCSYKLVGSTTMDMRLGLRDQEAKVADYLVAKNK